MLLAPGADIIVTLSAEPVAVPGRQRSAHPLNRQCPAPLFMDGLKPKIGMERKATIEKNSAGRPNARRSRSSKLRMALLAAGLWAVPHPAEAHSTHPAIPGPLSADTVRGQRFPVLPFNLGNRELLSTEYLERALRESGKTAAVRGYAARYDISRDLARQIIDVARSEGIDPELAFRLVRVESRFNVRARGPQGALGLVQLMPATARWLDRSLRTEADILEPSTNLRVGFRYLRALIERFGGDVRLGLLAYNRGGGTVSRALKRGADPGNGYSRKVLGARDNRYQGDGLLERE